MVGGPGLGGGVDKPDVSRAGLSTDVEFCLNGDAGTGGGAGPGL
jgi:hypothetical protein